MKVYVSTDGETKVTAYSTVKTGDVNIEVEQKTATFNTEKIQGYKIVGSKDGNNYLVFEQAQYDAYLAQQQENEEKAKACEMYNELQKQSVLDNATDEQALVMTQLYNEWDGNSVGYKKGQRVRYNGTLFKVLQDHTSQSDWTPDTASSLFAKVLVETDENGTQTTISEWTQPDSTNPYNTGDRVTYNGKTYESTIDNNVWAPDAYPAGWTEVTE